MTQLENYEHLTSAHFSTGILGGYTNHTCAHPHRDEIKS